MSPVDFRGARGLLFDMDGVWFVGDRAVPGAVETLAHLRSRGLPLRFITNTTTKSLEDIETKMLQLGLDIPRLEIIHSPRATVLYLRNRGNPSCHLIVSENVRPDFAQFPSSQSPDFVVIGDIGDEWNYAILNDAFRKVIDGAELLAMHRGKYWQVEDGLALDIGAFVAGLEYATGREAILVGKPAPLMFRSALADLGLDPAEVVMIGDDIHNDIAGAQGAGVPGVLVRTGKFRDELVARAGITPDAILDSVADLRELL